jgi:hypothetical protein
LIRRIMITLPPKRSRRKPKAAPVTMPKVIVEARDPRRIRREPALATRIVDHGKVPELSEDELRQREAAADQLWQEIKRAVAQQS